ncbi:hypothetical protein KR018_006610 [Drosophila ironensis]|nr:hypothetical protein KR018_006610 [Drosophila ironensis]
MAKCECFLFVSLFGMGLVPLILSSTYPATWKCLYKEFPVDAEKIKGGWWVYASNPEVLKKCYFDDLDLYWTRITATDYANYAVELHCVIPWMHQQLAIYTRAKEPSPGTLQAVESYLKTVKLSMANFTMQPKPKDCQFVQIRRLQRWYLPSYMHLDIHPHNAKPLVVNENI